MRTRIFIVWVIFLVSISGLCTCVSAELTDMQKAIDERYQNIEGNNQVLFTDTKEQKAVYIPQTGWRELERDVQSESCTFTLVSVSEGVDEEEVKRFLSASGEYEKHLNLSPGNFFLVELNGAHWISSISMSMAEGSIVDMRITDVNGQKKYFSARFTVNESIAFNEEKLCTYICFECPEDTNAETELFRLGVEGKPAFYQQIMRENNEDSIVLDERNDQNPLSIWRKPIRQSVYKLAEHLLNGHEGLTPHQKIMVFMDYISDWYVGLDNGKHYIALDASIESCGGYSNVLAALATTQGMGARIVNLCNYPPLGGHTICEVYYNNGWHIYDPTYGAYYTTTLGDTVSPYVLSFEELSTGRGNQEDVLCVVTSAHRLTSGVSFGFLGPKIYECADPKGVIGPSYPMIYPLKMDMSIGSINQQEFTTQYQGISYIGIGGVNSSHMWNLTGLEQEKHYQFKATGAWVGGESGKQFTAFAVSDDTLVTSEIHMFDNEDPDSMVWTIVFVPKSETVQILLTHDYSGPDLCYIRFQSFELTEQIE